MSLEDSALILTSAFEDKRGNVADHRISSNYLKFVNDLEEFHGKLSQARMERKGLQ